MQTTLGLCAHGYDVTAVVDVIGSGAARQEYRAFALTRLQRAGVILASTEPCRSIGPALAMIRRTGLC